MTIIDSLGLFPLSDVVLLPEVSVPLYVFEPRYRQMTRDALEGGHQIGMVTVRPAAVGAMAGDPPIFDIGCLGRIANAQERPDGTYQVLLLGETRFRVLEETPPDGSRLYRTGRVELIDDILPAGDEQHALMERGRADLLDLLDQLIHRMRPESDHASALEGFAGLEPARLVNALTQSIAFSPIERQQLLEADSILGRFETMSDLLRFRLAAVGMQDPGTSSLPN